LQKESRDQRLREDLAALQAMKEESTIFDFESDGDPPDRYTVIFNGKGICELGSGQAVIEFLDQHRCELRLPYSYPERGPDIRWLTKARGH